MNNSREKFKEQIAKRLYSQTASVSKSESSQDELFKGNTWSGFESHKELDLFTLLFEFLPESTHVYHIHAYSLGRQGEDIGYLWNWR